MYFLFLTMSSKPLFFLLNLPDLMYFLFLTMTRCSLAMCRSRRLMIVSLLIGIIALLQATSCRGSGSGGGGLGRRCHCGAHDDRWMRVSGRSRFGTSTRFPSGRESTSTEPENGSVFLLSREYAKSVDSLGSQSSESGHMSLFTVNFFLSGVHQSSDLDPMTPDQSQTCL